MPPRWSRVPTREDADFRKLDDRMNFAVHVAVFAAINSGLWFFHNFLNTGWEWLSPFSLGWFTILVAHLIYIGVIADYSK